MTKYKILVDSEIVDKNQKAIKKLKAGETVSDLTPAQIKGLTANEAIEAVGAKITNLCPFMTISPSRTNILLTIPPSRCWIVFN